MKKLLLTTTAIAAFGVVAEAEANSLQVNVGGYVDFQAGLIDDDRVDAVANTSDTDFNTDAEIHFSVDGKADNGLEYGAVVELEADVASGSDNYDAGNNADKAYVYLQGGWGRIEAGENTGAEEALAVNTGNFASATGGVDGDFYRYISAPAASTATINTNNGAANTVAISSGFNVTKPKLALGQSGTASLTDQGADEDATKITYYSPRMAGFQLGVSYTPNSGDTARAGAAAVAAVAENEDLFSGGINYTNQFDEVGVAASLTALSGSAKSTGVATAVATGGAVAPVTATNQDIEGYAAGLNVSLAGFTAGGSYADYQDTLGGDLDTSYYDLGLGYAAGPWSASVTYLKSEIEGSVTVADGAGANPTDTVVRDSEFENIVVGADYQLAPGLVPYIEASFYEFDSADATALNEGTVVMIGTELTF